MVLSTATLAVLRFEYATPREGHSVDSLGLEDDPDPRLVALLDSYERLIALRDCVGAFLPDLRTSDGSCTVCDGDEWLDRETGAWVQEHTEDCPVGALVAAYARVSPDQRGAE